MKPFRRSYTIRSRLGDRQVPGDASRRRALRDETLISQQNPCWL